ncbi:MAG: hypothetical protein Q9173_003199 [Seirophora scorigena]
MNLNLQDTEKRLRNSHPIQHHFSKSPSNMITRNDAGDSERRSVAATPSRNNKDRKTQPTCPTMDTNPERSTAAHLAGQTTLTPPTTPRNKKRKHKDDNTRWDDSSFKRRRWNPVHPNCSSSKPATVDLTTPKSSERPTSACDRSPIRSHGRRRQRSTNNRWRYSYSAKSTPKSRRRSGSHRRQAVSAFEAVRIPKSSICKGPAGAKRTNPNGVQGQVRRRQPPRQAKPWPSIEIPMNQSDGGDTPYPWDEPVVYNTDHIRQWEIDNVLNGFEPRASPARERDETFDPGSSMPASEFDTTPSDNRRRSSRMRQDDDAQPESSAAAERRRYRTHSSNRCSSTATRFKREVTAAIEYVSTYIDLTGNDDKSLPTSESESHIHRIGLLTKQLAQMKAWLQEEPELAAANRMECEALLVNADALARKLLLAKTAGLQSLSESGQHLKPPARIVAATGTESNGTAADDTCNNREVPAAQGLVVKRREYETDQKACERVIRARSASPRGLLGAIHYRGELSIPSDPPFPQPTRNRDIASKVVPHRASGHPKRQPQQAHSNPSKSKKEEARVNTAETVIVHAVGGGPMSKSNVTNATRAVETEDQNGSSTTSKEHGTVCKRDKGKGRADEYAHVTTTDSGLRHHHAVGHQARQGDEVDAHQSIDGLDERAVHDATDAAVESRPDFPDLPTSFRRHNLSRNNQAMTGSTQLQPHHKASDTANGTVNSHVDGDKPVGEGNAQKPPKTALPRHYRFPITMEREQPPSKGSCHPSLPKSQSRSSPTNVPHTRLRNRVCGGSTLNARDRSTASMLPSRGCDAVPICAATAQDRPILTSPNNIWVPPWRKVLPVTSQTLGPIAPHVFYRKDALRAESRQPQTPVSAGLARTDDQLTATDPVANIKLSVEASPSRQPITNMTTKFKGIRGMSYLFPAAAQQGHGLPTPICSSSPLRAKTDVSRATDRQLHSHTSATVSSDSSPGNGVRVPGKRKGGQQAPSVTPAKSLRKHRGKRLRDLSPPATPITSRKRTKSKQAVAGPCREPSSSSVLPESTGPAGTYREDRQPPPFDDNDDNDGMRPFIPSSLGQGAPLQDIREPSGDFVQAVQQDVPPSRSKNTITSPRPAGEATMSSKSEERPSKGKSKKVEKQRPVAADTTTPIPEAPSQRPRRVGLNSQDGLPSDSCSHAVERSKPSLAHTTTAEPLAEATNGPAIKAPPERARRLPTPATAAQRGIAPMYENPLLKAFKQARRPLGRLAQPRRTVPHQERASDAELIRICRYASPKVRRLSAPYAFGKKGKLYIEYHYLVHVKSAGWDDELKTRLTGKEKADWPPERL